MAAAKTIASAIIGVPALTALVGTEGSDVGSSSFCNFHKQREQSDLNTQVYLARWSAPLVRLDSQSFRFLGSNWRQNKEEL